MLSSNRLTYSKYQSRLMNPSSTLRISRSRKNSCLPLMRRSIQLFPCWKWMMSRLWRWFSLWWLSRMFLCRSCRLPRTPHLGRSIRPLQSCPGRRCYRWSHAPFRSWPRCLRQDRSAPRPGSERSRCSRFRSCRSRPRRYRRPPSRSRQSGSETWFARISSPGDNQRARPRPRLPEASEPRSS